MASSQSLTPGGQMPWDGNRQERMAYIFQTGFMSDATLLIGLQKQEIRVHRFVLQFASPVFYENFQKIGGGNQLVLPDVDPQVFIMFLKHLYLGDSGAAVEECFPLLDLATKYQVQDLIYFCSDKLNGNFTDENVTMLFQQAMEFGHQELTEATLAYLCRNAYKIVDSEAFLDLRQECLYEILKRDDLRVNNELHIFNAVLRWGEAECRRQKIDPDDPENLRKVVTKVMGLIRFPLMEAEEFTLNVAMRNILAEKELLAMLLFFNVSISKRSAVPQGRFNTSPRNYYNIEGNFQAPPVRTPIAQARTTSLNTSSSRPQRDQTGFQKQNFNIRLLAFRSIGGLLPPKEFLSQELLHFSCDHPIVITGLQFCTEMYPYTQPGSPAELTVLLRQANRQLIMQAKMGFTIGSNEITFSPQNRVNLQANVLYSVNVILETPMGNVPNQPGRPGDFSYQLLASNEPRTFYIRLSERMQQTASVSHEYPGQTYNFKFLRHEDSSKMTTEYGMIKAIAFAPSQ